MTATMVNVRQNLGRIADVQLSSVDKLTIEGEQPVLLCNYVDVYKNDYITSAISFMEATATPSEIAQFSLQPGDVLLTKDSESWNDIGVPAVVTEELPGVVCGYHLAMVRPKPMMADGRYLFWALKSPEVAEQFNVAANGVTRFGIPKQGIRDIEVPLPPLDEQRAIARFLDRKSRRIARLIHARQRMIALLDEQKQAIIHQAVTRGLDPDIPLKPSGIDWLGDIPAHWNVQRLKTLGRMRSGDSITSSDIESTGDYPVYGGNGLRGFTSSFTHQGSHLLIGRQGALCGNVHAVDGEFWASEHAIVTSVESEVDTLWFEHLLRTMNLNQYSIAAAQPGLAVERIINLWAPVPPMNEQEAISRSITHAGASQVIAQAVKEIGLLREYRTRLIADVVTGRLDIRDHPDAAEGTPDEMDDLSNSLDGILDEDVPTTDSEDHELADEAAG